MGLLDGMLQGQQAQPQQGGGLLASMGGAQQPAQDGQMPPEMMEAIQQMKGASPEERQQFIQQVTQAIQSAPKDPAQKEQVMQQFMQAMGAA
ncbi:MAG: hypothetical protein V4633_13565 [Pseudomonadota bacterium]